MQIILHFFVILAGVFVEITKKYLYIWKKSSTFAAEFAIRIMESIKNILAITGKPGLYKLVSRGNNMLIVESLVDGKRMPTYARDKIVALSDVSMFTDGDDVTLS